MKTKKQDFALMQILEVHEINRIICETNMGVLKLRIRKGEQDYKFVLDSVELPKEVSNEIYELLYAPEIPQVTTEFTTRVNLGPSVSGPGGGNGTHAQDIIDNKDLLPTRKVNGPLESLGIKPKDKKQVGHPKKTK